MVIVATGGWSPALIGSQRSRSPGATGGWKAADRAAAATPIPAQRSAERIGTRGRPTAEFWALVTVLVIQAALSLRLIWTNTAFQDEGLYLRAGNLEWARWLHHSPIPDFPSYFSGAPVLYPPMGALADSVGGLVAARVLSLCFMLGVTVLLWATTRRLYGRRAALLATGLFATLAGSQFLGAFATFDATALFLMSLATWLAVRSAGSRPGVRTVLVMTAGITLATADAVKYATAVFTPVVIAIAAMTAWRRRGGLLWLATLLTLLGSWLVAITAAVLAGGSDYWHGITSSTLARPPSDATVTAILKSGYIWTSLILVLAILGAVLAAHSQARARLMPAVLAAGALVAPIEQARLHTIVSLQKHVVFGAWFAAVAAGYALARLSQVDPGRGWAAVMALPIAASTLFGSMGQAASLYRAWPNSSAVVATLRSAIRSHPGRYLAEDYDVEAYYLRAQAPWSRWSNTYYFRYGGQPPGAPSYQAAISGHYFSLVILNFGDTAATDATITADMRLAGGYQVLTHVGPYTIWTPRSPTPAERQGGGSVRV
jgi:hypothetical protein